jgi:hypothetical protein
MIVEARSRRDRQGIDRALWEGAVYDENAQSSPAR